MHSIASDYLTSLSDLDVSPPSQRWPIEMISSVTSHSVSNEALGPEYWVHNLLSPVHFSTALSHLCTPSPSGRKKGQRRRRGGAVGVLIEIGPHAVLAGPVKQVLAASTELSKAGISYLPSLVRDADGAKTMLSLIAALTAAGHGADVHTANFPSPHPTAPLAVVADLPSYDASVSADGYPGGAEHGLESHRARMAELRTPG
ncbi:hypothetical protein V495_08030 [Pseudogymnoascus sp. VKM F-4514 (FW-929)]|nr:hypothetical protein V495_08030 [Pseudogymnoascus sp. VKM F-4514 (FW-929)]